MQKSKDDFGVYKSISVVFFALIISAGFVLAYFVYRCSDSFLSSLMHRALSCSVSIVDLMTVSSISILFTALAAAFNNIALLYFLCFAKSLQYSFVAFAVYETFRISGWLAQLLFMFSDTVITVLLFAVGIRCILHRGRLSYQKILAYVSLCMFTILLDAFMIAPITRLLRI